MALQNPATNLVIEPLSSTLEGLQKVVDVNVGFIEHNRVPVRLKGVRAEDNLDVGNKCCKLGLCMAVAELLETLTQSVEFLGSSQGRLGRVPVAGGKDGVTFRSAKEAGESAPLVEPRSKEKNKIAGWDGTYQNECGIWTHLINGAVGKAICKSAMMDGEETGLEK